MLRHFPSLMQACVDDNCDEPENNTPGASRMERACRRWGRVRPSPARRSWPRAGSLMRVAIIGAGIAGLACARRLRDAGLEATLFDKSRGVGGRLATRRADPARPEVTFDHGATHFTARSEGFTRLVAAWETAGLAARWPAAGADSWVGTPTMTAPLKALADDLDVRLSRPVTALTKSRAGWTLQSEAKRLGTYDAAVIAIPAEQAAPLLSLHDFEMARAAMSVRYNPCWTGMLAFDQQIDELPDFLRGAGFLATAARDSAKPGRAPGERWVVQADWAWSEAHLSCDSASVAPSLLAELGKAAGREMPAPSHISAHRWLFAQPSGQDQKLLWNPALSLGACGDWLHHGFAEYAWLSGHVLGAAIAAGAAQ
ncbi:NAD(P)/FAD-dependent oxidoreductase [Sphingopyxis sp. H115]|uniref:NAD(P)/FAD-dependent oxidoreductase n=1 Tax=Sphingopyxis sp. H115 TaxID=1759073 RepID=UPI002AA2A624|nr:FAD-dependent oxidoreductase [Sphingopyxis sp. H115]